MSDIGPVSPTSDEICDRLREIAIRHDDWAEVRVAGKTALGRPIYSVEITDRRVDPADKQHVLIVAGQHGNEESARLVAMRLIDYLLSADGRPLLRRQVFVVMPNISPDAAEANSYETPAGIKPNLDHGPSGPVSPEATALRRVAERFMPELYVDIHARGHAGWSHDMVLFPATRPYTEDEHLLHQIASVMADAGEKSGIPHVVHPLTWPGWGGADLDQPSSTMYMYRRFKALVFLTENAEDHLNPLGSGHSLRKRVLSGLNRLKPLLAMGNTRHAKHFYSGYPVSPVVGMFHAGVVAVGETAADRRVSRLEIWQHYEAFREVGLIVPEANGVKRLRIVYDGPRLSRGVGFQTRAAGRLSVQSVSVNGKKLRPSETNGFFSWHDKHTTFAVAALRSLAACEYEFVFHFQ